MEAEKNAKSSLIASYTTAPTSKENQPVLAALNKDANSKLVSGSQEPKVRTYPIRWFILVVICLANITNAINWICFSPIANLTASFFNVGYGAVNILSSVFMITAILFGFLSCLLIDLVGIKMSIILGAWLNFIGAFIRVFSSFDEQSGLNIVSRNGRFGVLLFGQIICSFGQSFLMFVTTKFATSWFNENQRGIANTLALGSSVLGNLIGAITSPMLVTTKVSVKRIGAVNEMAFMLILYAAFSFIPALMACFIRRSLPKLPPSYSSAAAKNSYELVRQTPATGDLSSSLDIRKEFKNYLRESSKLMKNRQFIWLFVCFGVGLGIFNAITTLIEQIFCVRGYTNNDAGYFAGVLILFGLAGSFVAGVVMDRTKRYELLAKICFSAIALLNVLMVVLQLFNNDNKHVYYMLLLSFCLLGFFALPLLPICFESVVECTYPLSESTSTGLLFISGQIFGILLIELYPIMASKVPIDTFVYKSIQTCVHLNTTSSVFEPIHQVLDYKIPMFSQLGLLIIASVAFIVFFKCPNLRYKAEKASANDNEQIQN